MGLAAINYAIKREDRKPSLMVVTDIDQVRLDRAALIYSPEWANTKGIKLIYKNTRSDHAVQELLNLTGGNGFDDVFIFAPVSSVIEQGDAILANDGCLNFFAGPGNPDFSAKMNFYNVHYGSTHIVGTSGGNNNDMIESLEMIEKGLDPAGLVTHVGGLNAVIDATLHLPEIPGGKKLIYTHKNIPLTAISEFSNKGKTNPLFAKLNEICENNNGLWSVSAEEYLLANADDL
jgi:threonine dehydrogenase-like Zn-dependent dehydrogenase